jgi:hypothetical protein
MAAQLRFEQATQPNGGDGEAVLTGISTEDGGNPGKAQKLTLRALNIPAGATVAFTVLDAQTVPKVNNAVLTPDVTVDTAELVFDKDIWGTFRIRLTQTLATAVTEIQTRVFSIPSPRHALNLRALNERADAEASSINNGLTVQAANERVIAGSSDGYIEELRRQSELVERSLVVSVGGGPLDIVVRDADGNDLTGTGSSAAPFKTYGRCLLALPDAPDAVSLIHLGPHLSGGYTPAALPARLLRAQIGIVGDGGGGVTDGYTVVDGPRTAAVGTDATKIIAPVAPSADEFTDEFIELLTGPGAGQFRLIVETLVGGDIIPSQDFSPAPDDTTTYRIVKPEVEFALTSSLQLFQGLGPVDHFVRNGDEPGIALVNLRLKGTAASSAYSFCNANYYAYGVQLDGSAGFAQMFFNNARLYSGIDTPNADVPVNLGLAAAGEWKGYGLSAFGGFASLQLAFAQMSGHANLKNGFQIFGQTLIVLNGGRLTGTGTSSGFSLSGSARAFFGGSRVIIDAQGSGDALKVEDGPSYAFVFSGTELRSVGGALVRVLHGAVVDLFGAGFVSGASSAGKAADASRGGILNLNGAPAITGSPGGSEFGTGGAPGDADVAGAFFAAPGDKISHPDQSIIRRVS